MEGLATLLWRGPRLDDCVGTYGTCMQRENTEARSTSLASRQKDLERAMANFKILLGWLHIFVVIVRGVQ